MGIQSLAESRNMRHPPVIKSSSHPRGGYRERVTKASGSRASWSSSPEHQLMAVGVTGAPPFLGNKGALASNSQSHERKRRRGQLDQNSQRGSLRMQHKKIQALVRAIRCAKNQESINLDESTQPANHRGVGMICLARTKVPPQAVTNMIETEGNLERLSEQLI